MGVLAGKAAAGVGKKEHTPRAGGVLTLDVMYALFVCDTPRVKRRPLGAINARFLHDEFLLARSQKP